MKGRTNTSSGGKERTQRSSKNTSASPKNKVLVAVTMMLMLTVMAVPMISVASDIGTSDDDMPLASWNGGIAAGFDDGTGTSSDPWQINTPEQLAYLSKIVNDGDAVVGDYYVLTANIYLNSADDLDLWNVWSDGLGPRNSWTPIGNYIVSFEGNFDGAGHTVYGMYISTTADYQGLFGLANNSSISKVGVEQSYVRGDDFVGGVAGYVSGGSITDCYNTGNVKGTGNNVGGVVGDMYGSIANCYNTGNVSGVTMVGGVAGCSNGTIAIVNCYNTGNVKGTGNDIGGVVGNLNSGTATNCYNTGSVSGGSNVGGVAGSISSGSVTNSYNTGTISGSNRIGGVAGQTYAGASVKNCYNTGTISGSSSVGGVVGNDLGSTIADCYYLSNGVPAGAGTSFDQNGILSSAVTVGSVTSDVLLDALNAWVASQPIPGTYYYNWMNKPYPVFATVWGGPSDSAMFPAGAGSADDPYQIWSGANLKYLYDMVEGSVSSFNNSGVYYALMNDIYLNDTAGWDTWNISGPVNRWTPIGSASKLFLANFDGRGFAVFGVYTSGSTSDNMGLFGYVYGNISNVGVEQSYISGRTGIGGVVGYAWSSSITNCYNTGNVAGSNNYAGGVVGYANNSNITNCYNTGDISSGGNVGGVAGSVDGSIITNCYNTGNVTGNFWVGGVAGVVAKVNGMITNCYNTGVIIGSGVRIGGVAGYIDEGGSVTNCYNTGDVTSISTQVGGVAGAVIDGGIMNCYNTGSVYGASDVGGVVGNLGTAGTVSCSYFLQTTAVNMIGISTGAVTYSGYFDATGAITAIYSPVIASTLIDALNLWATNPMYGANNYSSWTGPVEEPTLKGSAEWNGLSATAFAGGTGTASDPYQIANAEQLSFLSDKVNANDPSFNDPSKYYVLTNDIYLNDTTSWMSWDVSAPTNSWVPIGMTSSFAANFDGQGFAVFGIYIDNGSYVGLFGDISGNVRNVGVEQSYISGDSRVGGVAGNVDGGSIINCYNTGIVLGSGNVGGVVGYVDGIITNCYNTGNVSGTSGNVGGVAGIVYNSNITNCYNTGNVSSTSDTVGGVAGGVTNGDITNCYNTGNVTAVARDYVGGVAGSVSGDITDCYNTGNVSGTSRIGGVAGSVSGDITDCYNTGNVSGTSRIGGVAGFVSGSNIEGCYNKGSVNGTGNNVGGVAGFVSGSNITNCYNTGSVRTTGTVSSLGGVAGYVDIGNITDCYNTGSVVGEFNVTIIGGIVGSTAGEIKNSYNIGNLGGAGNLGGVAGSAFGDIKNSYNTGSLISTTNVGGVAGHINGGKIEYSYNTGMIVAMDDSIGGVAGYVQSGSVENSYNAGPIGVGDRIGGVAGYVYDGSITNSYNTGSVNGGASVGGVAGQAGGTSSITNSYNAGSVTGDFYEGGIIGSIIGTVDLSYCYFRDISTGAIGTGVAVSEVGVSPFAWAGSTGTLPSGVSVAGQPASTDLVKVLNNWVNYAGKDGYLKFAPGLSYERFEGLYTELTNDYMIIPGAGGSDYELHYLDSPMGSGVSVAGTFATIQGVIDFIKADLGAGNGGAKSLTFGDSAALDIVADNITFSDADTSSPDWNITLYGELTSSHSTAIILEANVTSKADITATAGTAFLLNSGSLTVTGGTISGTTAAISAPVAGSIVLGGNPTITGSIIVTAGNLSVIGGSGTDKFDPAPLKTYDLDFVTPADGAVAVVNGAGLDSFFTVNSGYVLRNGIDLTANDLILRTEVTVTYDLNGGPGTAPAAEKIAAGETIASAPLGGPWTMSGHISDGNWYSRAGSAGSYVFTKFEFGPAGTGTAVGTDTTLYLTWSVDSSATGDEYVVTANASVGFDVAKLVVDGKIALVTGAVTVQDAIEAIRTDQNGAGACSITFNDTATPLSVDTGIEFKDDGGEAWGTIYLKGELAYADTGTGTAIQLNGVTVVSTADITSDGQAFDVHASNFVMDSGTITGTATVIVTDAASTFDMRAGTISSASGTLLRAGGPVSIIGLGTITTGGTTAITALDTVVLGGSPSITGRIVVASGKLSVIDDGTPSQFSPSGTYSVFLSDHTLADNMPVVFDGANFLSAFVLLNPGCGLKVLSIDLVLEILNPTVSGTVTSSGTGVKDVTVSYTINGTPGTVPTDLNGEYSIPVTSGDSFVFVSVTRTGFLVVESLPISFTVAGSSVYDFTMTLDPAYRALDLTINGTGSVTVGGTVYTATDTIYIADGTTVTLTAGTTNFVGWSGNVASNAAIIYVEMTSDKSVTATFNASGNVTLDLTIVGTGTVTVNSATYDASVRLYFEQGMNVLISESSTSPWVFSYGTINNAVPFYNTYTPQSVTLLSSSTTAYMLFLDTGSSRSIDLSADPAIGGTVSWSFTNNGTTVTRTGNGYAPASATVTISVSADAAYEFIYWSGSISGIADTITSPASDGNIAATAHFALSADVITITVDVEGSGGVDVYINGTYVMMKRSTFTLKTSVNYTTELDAIPDEGYSFSHWTVGGTDTYDKRITLTSGDPVKVVFTLNKDEGGWEIWIILVILIGALIAWWLILRDKDDDEEEEAKKKSKS